MRPVLNLSIGVDGERICLNLHFTLFDWEFSYVKAYGTIIAHFGPVSLVFYRPHKIELDTNNQSN